MRSAYIYIFMFVIFLVVGCSTHQYKTMSQSFRLGLPILKTTNQVRYVEISSDKVESFLASQGINPQYKNTADDKYCVVEEDWFVNTLLKEYYTFIDEVGIKEYQTERNDCDDYCRAFTFFCKIKSLRTLNINHSLTVADVFFHKNGDKKRNHAINLAIVLDKEGKLKLIYIEPQDASVFLNEDNRNISRNVYFWGM